MDQVKIGNLIASLRKELKMTQLELANKIGVSDRTISKWENGRGMPELSLIKPLCDALGITVNELLNGEKNEIHESNPLLEDTLLSTLDYSAMQIKKDKKEKPKAFKFADSCNVSHIGDVYPRCDSDESSAAGVFSTWGFEYYPPIDLSKEEIEETIRDSMIQIAEEHKRLPEIKCFVSMKIYGIEDHDNKTYVYAWILVQRYYQEDKEIIKDSGSSVPYQITLTRQTDRYFVEEIQAPRDGSYYEGDMKKLFPRKVRKQMNQVFFDGTSEKLHLDIQKQVELYFH